MTADMPATCGACRHMRTDRMDDGTDHNYCDGPRSLGATRAEEAPPSWCWLRAMTPVARPGPGRPPGPPGSQRTARLVVRVTPADVAAYQAAARRAGVSVGELVRLRMAGGEAEYNRGHGDGMKLVADLRLSEAAAAEKEHEE